MRRSIDAALLVAGVLAALVVASPPVGAQEDPPYSVDHATMDAALDCDEFEHPDKEPVLLVHGTFTTGHEQYDWNYALLLRSTGHDVCILTYPNRGFDDMQISAEYVARAVQRIHAESGRKVDMVGHSQGALMPRWAIKWWPSVQEALDDFVMLAGPNHGTAVAGFPAPPERSAAFFQMRPGSAFIEALNAGDEAPGAVDHTSIYTLFDELVQPPETAALDVADPGPNVVNILLQDLCPARVVDHLSIGTTDALTHALVLDALDHDGPTDVERVDPDEVLCNLPDQYVVPESFVELLTQFEESSSGGFPTYTPVDDEPPLRDYARADDTDGAAPDETGPEPVVPEASPAPAATGPQPAAPGARTLPATGRAIPFLAAGVAIGVALLLRAGRSRLDDRDDD